jgi:hypothetical protein
MITEKPEPEPEPEPELLRCLGLTQNPLNCPVQVGSSCGHCPQGRSVGVM